MTARIAPFLTYLFFLALAQVFSSIWPGNENQNAWAAHGALWLYPLKTAIVLALLIHFWPQYRELQGKIFSNPHEAILTVVVGLLVYALWVRMEWSWAVQGDGAGKGYNPFQAGPGMGLILAGIRIFGASIVVPVMEELFWRSFLIRYLISSKFESVALGTFSVFSFVATIVMFGLEHDLWLAGMVAGMAYTGLLYYTKRLWPSIIAHAVTNFALGVHVLVTGEWRWW